MVFSSSVSFFAFLPLFLAVFFVLPWRPAKNVVLLLFSLLFYAWGEPIYVFLMIGSIIINWLMALVISQFDEKGSRLGALVIALTVNIGILGVFKYETFVATNMNLVLGEEFLADLQLALPIGFVLSRILRALGERPMRFGVIARPAAMRPDAFPIPARCRLRT